jgi:hypothetical protein
MINEYPGRSNTDLKISLKTLLGCTSMLHPSLENRDSVALAQNIDMLTTWQEHSRVDVDFDGLDSFCVAPFDVLLERSPAGKNRFHIIELNGTGIGGLTNLPSFITEDILNSIADIADKFPNTRAPLILVALSGKEDASSPRLNKLLHEKLLYVEAIYQRLRTKYQEVHITTAQDYTECYHSTPTVVLGYMKDLLRNIVRDTEGQLFYKVENESARLIDGVINDRFFLNVCQKFQYQVDTRNVVVRNGTFLAGADKATAYTMWNEYLQTHRNPMFPDQVDFSIAYTLDDIVASVHARLDRNIPCVIKPSGTGTGHGIEFFFPQEDPTELYLRIQKSVEDVGYLYGLRSGAYPYTISQFIPTRVIEHPGTYLNHKFEIRVVVYRGRNGLFAVPSIAKISSKAFDPDLMERMSLINNITAASESTLKQGQEFMLPLANIETLQLLDIDMSEMNELSKHCSHFMAFLLEKAYAQTLLDSSQFQMARTAFQDRPLS